MPPPEYSTAYQSKLEQISEFRRELQVVGEFETVSIKLSN